MAALIAPRCVRYTVSGNYGETTWANILDFRLTANDGIPRAQAIQEHAEVVVNAWESELSVYQSQECFIRSISWVDLDSENGSTGAIPYNIPGNDSNPCLPANVAVLIKKLAPGGGRQARNGRLYLVGCNEDAVEENRLAGTFQGALNNDLDQFLAFVSETQGADFPNYSASMTVIHQRNQGTPQNPDYVYNGDDFVNEMQVDPIIATQRRRARR